LRCGKTIRCCLILLAVLVFMADLADDGKLGRHGHQILNKLCCAYAVDQDTGDSLLKPQKIPVEPTCIGPGRKFSADHPLVFLTTLHRASQFPKRPDRAGYLFPQPRSDLDLGGKGCDEPPSGRPCTNFSRPHDEFSQTRSQTFLSKIRTYFQNLFSLWKRLADGQPTETAGFKSPFCKVGRLVANDSLCFRSKIEPH
jgi:hypothetical protein